MQEICRFLDLFYHLEVIELLHGLCLDLVTHVDVWLHGLVVTMASPLHDNLRRDAHAEGIADERASVSVGADDFVFGLDLVKTFITPIVRDSDRFYSLSCVNSAESGQRRFAASRYLK